MIAGFLPSPVFESGDALAPVGFVSGVAAAPVTNKHKGLLGALLSFLLPKAAVTAAPAILSDAVIVLSPVVGSPCGYTPATASGSPPPTITGRQWTLDGSNIGGATSITYTPVAGDATHSLAIKETWSNIAGSATSTSAGFTVSAASGSSSLAISWVLPTTMSDGSAIGTITGQTVYWDIVPRMGTGVAYANSVAVGDGVSTSKTLTSLPGPGTAIYYALTVTVGGIESDLGVEFQGFSA